MTYIEQQWADNNTEAPYGPINAVRLQHIEDGLATVANGGSISYVAAPTGVSATDCAAFAAALAALPSTGGLLLLNHGSYDFTNGVTISKPCTVLGAGGPDTNWTACPTEIVCSSGTATPITVSSSAVTLRGFGVRNTAVSAPTAGQGILDSTGHIGNRFEDIGIQGFYDLFTEEGGGEWWMRDCVLMDAVRYYVRVTAGDDWTFAGNYLRSHNRVSTGALLRIEGTQGAKVVGGNKFLCGTSPTSAPYCIDVQAPDGSLILDALISDNSLEGFSVAAVNVGNLGPLNTGQVQRFQVCDNQIATDGVSGAYGLHAVCSTGTKTDFSRFVVVGNQVEGVTNPWVLSGCDTIDIGINGYFNCGGYTPGSGLAYAQTPSCTHVTIAPGTPSTTLSAEYDSALTTTATSFGTLTNGPAVTVPVGASGRCRVTVSAEISNSGAGGSYVTFSVSGQSAVVAATTNAAYNYGTTKVRASLTTVLTGLTSGDNIFTTQYAVDSGTGTFNRARITAEPF